MSFSISPTASTSALPQSQRKSRQASSSAFSPTGSAFPRNESFATINGVERYGSPVGQGLPGRRPFDSLSMSMRQVSSASVSMSGTSTPDYKRRARRMVERGMIKESEIERDWGNIEPDEVFRRLPVGEVRKVEAKMRTDALGKQAELRSMVGDLLTSATQITALHNSSIRLSRQLRNIADISSNPDTIAITAETASDVSDTDDVLARLPAAAHMKLLLDATEALYVYLGNKEYLRAAYLWLVARVTKEGLSRMTDDVGSTYQPLLQKQWEMLLPFRSQIVQQATESLRSHDAGDIKSLSDTILAIILLDNLAVHDALNVLLDQRTLALRSTLSHPASPSIGGRKRSNSKLNRSDRDDITSTLRSTVQHLLATVSSAQAVFAKSTTDAESLIERLIRLVQIDSSMPTITAPAPLRRTSSNTSATHHRRASRLVSISIPSHRTEGGEEAPISTTDIISALPSAQILLRHLPPAVLTYTPFLTPPTDARVREQVDQWTDSAIGILREATPQLLVDLTSVQAVWQVRGVMADMLAEGQVEGLIKENIGTLCVERIQGIWKADLDGLVSSTSRQVEAAVHRIVEEAKDEDTFPEKHLFGNIAFPSVNTTLNTPSVTVPSFIAALKRRSAYRTPILDGILTALESSAAAIKADRQGLPQSICNAYEDMSARALGEMVDALRQQLTAAADSHGGSGMYGELLVGRVALFMASTSTILPDLSHGGHGQGINDRLLEVHAASVSTWQLNALSTAIAHLDPLFASSRSDNVEQTWQAPLPLGPSAELLHSLHYLAGATRALGIPPGIDRPAVRDLVKEYGRQALGLAGWMELQGSACVQAVVDLGWLNVVLGRESKDGPVQDLLEKVPDHLKESISESLDTIIADSLRRTQLLLQPILVLVSPDAPVFVASADQPTPSSRGGAAGKWLAFGPPANQIAFPRLPLEKEQEEEGSRHGAEAKASQVSSASATAVSEFRSPVAVAKPGKRFNLLSITS